MNSQNTFRKVVLSDTSNLLKLQSEVMHKALVLLVAIYALVFSSIDFIFNQSNEGVITVMMLPMAFFSFLLYKKGYVYVSKLFNVVQTIVFITLLSIQTGIESLSFMYYFPISIATFLLFQGKERITAYVVSILTFLVLIVITYMDIEIGHYAQNPVDMKLDKYLNIIGVAVLCMLEMYFITSVSSRIQHKLVASSKALNVRNKQLSSTIYTRDRMMSVISHDLRSPVATLDTAADILNAGGLDPEVQKSFFRQFKLKTSHLLILIDQLLDWSRTQTNTIRMNRTDIGLDEMDRYIKGLAGLLSSEKKVKIVVDFNGAEQDSVNCDRHMIEGVFRNLISNAVKFSDENGTVRIYSRKLESGREFIVEDHGRGMTQEQIDNLQKKVSFTTEGTLNEVGHGFGLQLVHEFLEKHGSELKIKSTVGKGSSFSFVL